MQVICLEDKAFKALLDEVIGRIQEQKLEVRLDKWISEKETMELFGITSGEK